MNNILYVFSMIIIIALVTAALRFIPFLVFAVALGMKNALVMMNKKALAIKVSKVIRR